MAVTEVAPVAWAPPEPGIANPSAIGHPGTRRRIQLERLVAFVVPLAGYLWVGVQLSLVYHSFIGDAISREANAYYVFFSNDPHLAAIGFVWNPLTSIAEMPLILLKGLWPALTTHAFAASIMSAIFMAGCCYQLIRFMEDIGVGRIARWLLVACFALNPIIVYSAGNGMSEALFMFTLLACTRRLAGWLLKGGSRDLVASGVWLALAYAARNEAAMAAIFASVVVLAVAYRRANGTGRQRGMSALTDAVIFVAPFTLSFAGWAAASWIIVGHPFEQFSSVYGTSSQLKILNANDLGRAKLYSLSEGFRVTMALAPLLPVVLAVAVARASREREVRVLAVLSVMGGVLFFEVAAFVLGLINITERYFIYAIPLIVLAAGLVARPSRKTDTEQREEQFERATGLASPHLAARRRQRRLLSALAVAGAVIAVLPGIFTTYHEMFYSLMGIDDAEELAWFVMPGSAAAKHYAVYGKQYAAIAAETARLDALHAPRGGIMVDDAVGCVPQMILDSRHPTAFTIPNDVGYTGLFGAPYHFGIRYMLVSDPHGAAGTLDSLDREWPTLYDTGAELGRRVASFTIAGCTSYRLYQLNPQSDS